MDEKINKMETGKALRIKNIKYQPCNKKFKTVQYQLTTGDQKLDAQLKYLIKRIVKGQILHSINKIRLDLKDNFLPLLEFEGIEEFFIPNLKKKEGVCDFVQ